MFSSQYLIFAVFDLSSAVQIYADERSNRRKILAVFSSQYLIFAVFDLSSAVQIYVSYIYINLFILHGYITNSQYDQLSVGLIAHAPASQRSWVRIPFKPEFFSRLSFRNCLSCVVIARIFLLSEVIEYLFLKGGRERTRWN